MKQLLFPIAATSFVLLIYLISVAVNLAFGLIFTLFTIGNALMIWMVIRILKDGTPSKHTFEDLWYEDRVR